MNLRGIFINEKRRDLPPPKMVDIPAWNPPVSVFVILNEHVLITEPRLPN